MRTIKLITISTLLSMSFFSAAYAEEVAIKNCQQLQDVRENLTANYILANDIDCSILPSKTFQPIGSTEQPFLGSLNGKGFIIKGLDIKPLDSHSPSALFTSIGPGANISNINFDSPQSQGKGSVAILVASSPTGLSSESVVENSINISNIKFKNPVLKSYGEKDSLTSMGILLGDFTDNAALDVDNFNSKKILSIKNIDINGATIEPLETTPGNRAGLAAVLMSAKVSHVNLNNIDIQTISGAGGVAAVSANTSYQWIYSNNVKITQKTIGERYTGTIAGLVGYGIYTKVSNCDLNTTISNAGDFSAGLIGSSFNSKVDNCSIWVNLSNLNDSDSTIGETPTNFYGGLFGTDLGNTTASTIKISGKIDVSNGIGVGGVLGAPYQSSEYANNSQYTDIESAIDLVGADSLGGLAGTMIPKGFELKNIVISGRINTTGVAGGALSSVQDKINFMPQIGDEDITAGNVNAQETTLENIFWSIDSTLQKTSAGEGAIGLSLEQMNNPEIFLNAGFGSDQWILESGHFPRIKTYKHDGMK